MTDSMLIPPGVSGRTRGTISITVDEVFWSTKSPGDIYVKFAWWGDDERFYEFFPKNSTKSGERIQKTESRSQKNEVDREKVRHTMHSWQIGTSLHLLEEYFRRWKCIVFNVYKIDDKRLVGSVQMENWNCILSEERYSSYFAITDRKGDRIGDLRITFVLKMKKKKFKLKSDFPIVKNAKTDGDNGQQQDPLAELLNKGQELRKAMVKSVLSTCDNKNLDDVVKTDDNTLQALLSLDDDEEKRQAKLVDYLTGKPLTAPEKEIAVQTLRCCSPTESVVEVAASIGDHLSHKSSSRSQMTESVQDSHRRKFCSVGETRAASIAYDRFADAESHSKKNSGRHASTTDARQPSTTPSLVPDEYFSEKTASLELAKVAVSSYKVIFEMMTLTSAGLKKVSTSPIIRPLSNKIRPAKSPGIVFSIETVIPFSPSCKAAYLKPLSIPSKAFGGDDVVFQGSVVQKMKRTRDGWSKVAECIRCIPVKIYWRCLNQRLPSLLGQCNFPDEIDSDDLEMNCQLPVFMANKQVAATLKCTILLGDSEVFGNQLLGDEFKRKGWKARQKLTLKQDSLQPQPSEIAPSRESTGSDKSSRANQTNLSVPHSLPPSSPGTRSAYNVPPPTASSTTRQELVEADQQLMNAIASLNDKLMQKTAPTKDVERPVEICKTDAKGKSTTEEPKQEPAPLLPGIVRPCQDAEDDTTSPRKLNGRCCCHCCHGCHGNNKRKKLPRRRHHLRDRKHPVNSKCCCSLAQNDESTAASNSEHISSTPAHVNREMLNESRSYHQRSRYHHSPPTKLNGESRVDLGYRYKGAGDAQPARRPYTFNSSARDYVKSRNQRHTSDDFQTDCNGGAFNSQLAGPANVHRFNVNVYSSDAQIFYREGELEIYMAYRFPRVDPISGKLFCPNEVSCLELSGDASPLTHYLPLHISLSDALLAYPKHHITFHIYARAFLYEKRDFLIGQAKLPLEKLVEWEAAHNYSQKRRAEHPLLPPDKFFINLRIQPSKGELPQNLEAGRIAQLGLEIDYEKFKEGADGSPNIWQLDPPPPPRPYCEPSYVPRDEIITDSSDLYMNSKRDDLGRDTARWTHQNGDDLPVNEHRLGKWGLRVVDSFSDPADLITTDPARVEGNLRPGHHKVGNSGLRSADFNDVDLQDNEEFMLILDNRHLADPIDASKNRSKTNKTDFLERQTDHGNGLWDDNSLQAQSISRLDPNNATDFTANEDFANLMGSPRVDRDFPQGVNVADFSSDENTNCRMNPFEVPVTVHRQPKDSIRHAARLRNDAKESPLPSLARMIDSNYDRNPNLAANLDSSCENGSDSKATQTSVNEPKSRNDLFSVRIEVEAAINLPSTVRDGERVKPSSRVEFDACCKGKEIIVQSSVVKEDPNPRYDSAWNVELPTHLLYKSESELEIRVVNVVDGSVSSAFIDLTTLSAGLPCIDGWFFLSNNGHKSAGQVKVTITPMESIRKYREEWIDECRKKKQESSRPKDTDRISFESAQKMLMSDSCTSSKFKEKMKELEQLTERMKQKLLNVEHWNDSPPCSLMRDVDVFAKNLLREEGNNVKNVAPKPTSSNKVDSKECAQDMPVLDLSTVQEFCPVDSSYNNLDHSVPTMGSSFALNEAPLAFRDHLDSVNPSVSRIRRPYMSRRLSRSIDSCHPVTLSNGLVHFGSNGSSPESHQREPINLISFDSSDEQNDSLPLNSHETFPTSPVNALIGEKFRDSDDSTLGREIGERLSLDKCHEELERLPRDSLDAASMAIEKMIAELRHQKADDSKS